MMRLLSSCVFKELFKRHIFVMPCVTERQVISLVPASSAYHNHHHQKASILSRHLNTGSPRQGESIDLDKWKSVLRSQAASAERQEDHDREEASEGDGSPREAGGGPEDPLDSTRKLLTVWRQSGKSMPDEISDEDVKLLAELTSKSAMSKYLRYLAIKESLKRSRKRKQLQKKLDRDASIEREEEGGSDLDETKNSWMLPFWSTSLDRQRGWRCAHAMICGQPLVFDMSYESSMTLREIKNTAIQLRDVEGWNRRATEPFHLHYCNLQPDSTYQKELIYTYGENGWNNLLITTTEHQHFDLFPRERLVYLTADSPNVLHTFDHSKIYIVGALVDLSHQLKLSLARAKRLGLATARLPLDQFLNWGTGGKNLTLDQMMRILLSIKETGKWEQALKFVPKRKHGGFSQERQTSYMKDQQQLGRVIRDI
ncbi:tRNA methyltransferase 10 homolog C [Aulostomus maculatus]